jgi:predicted RNA-binding Zn ribbon-like protein
VSTNVLGSDESAIKRPSRSSRSVSPMDPRFGDDAVSVGLLCLEFVAVGRELRAPDLKESTIEQRLVEWFTRFGLPVPVGGLTANDITRAQSLCDAINATARALMTSTKPVAQDIRDLNEFAHHPTPVFLLRGDGRQRVAQEVNDVAATFSVVARDAINTFATADLRRIRACAGCDLLFYDRSPQGRRRWCSMKRCGERAASALYRQRHASAVKQPSEV